MKKVYYMFKYIKSPECVYKIVHCCSAFQRWWIRNYRISQLREATCCAVYLNSNVFFRKGTDIMSFCENTKKIEGKVIHYKKGFHFFFVLDYKSNWLAGQTVILLDQILNIELFQNKR